LLADRAVSAVVDGAGLALVAAGREGLLAVDVRDPDRLAIVQGWAMPGLAERLAIANGRVYVATESGGLQIVDLPPNLRTAAR
jgi:hypothetical protein